jgi:predicted transcriptional regulator
MKRDRNDAVPEEEVLRRFFGTDDLMAFFGTDDPLEILADIDPEGIVGSDAGFQGFEEEAEQMKGLFLMAKQLKARLDKARKSGSLEFLAEKLGKTQRQIREYCRAGYVPGAYQTKGGHWRVKYDTDTVKMTCAAIGKKFRQRTDGVFMKHLRELYDRDSPKYSGDDFSLISDKFLARIKPSQIPYAEAVENLRLQNKLITVRGVARLTGRSPTTVRKYAPHVTRARVVPLANNPIVDNHIEELNKRLDGKVRTSRRDTDDSDNPS